jgi:pyruvate formate lyase activating enzyme
MKYEARYYEKLPNSSVRCMLCPQNCVISPGQAGICRGRENVNGTLYAKNYGECVSLSMDPIEKKPLYHFFPGSSILSTASNSCNLKCRFCQNAEISQKSSPTQYVSPRELVDIALRQNSIGIAYTYTEPLTWYEYVIDVAKLAHEHSLKNVLVTNGMINEAPLMKLLPHIDAANIDLKSMDSDFYENIVHGKLETVLNTIKIAKKHWHVELTNLVIPGYNDSHELISRLVDFVVSVGVETPLHFSRYFPNYQFSVPATPAETLKSAYKIAREKLRYVYVGNVWTTNASDTHCPKCGNLLVDRSHYQVLTHGIKNGRCNKCGKSLDFML